MNLRKQNLALLAVTLLTFVSLSRLTLANELELSRPCNSVLRPLSPLEFEALHQFHPAVKADAVKSVLLDDFPVHNQGKYGCCWTSSASGNFERELYKVFGKHIPLSDEYQILITLFYRVEEALFYGDAIFQGGWQETANWMFTNIGIYPNSGGWKPKKDLMAPGAAKEFLGFLNFEIANYQAQLKLMHKSGATNEAAWEYTLKKRTELHHHMRTYLGNPPSSFTLDADGKKYTPNSFLRTILSKTEIIQIVDFSPSEPRAALRTNDESAEVIQPAYSLFELFPDTRKFLVPKPAAKGQEAEIVQSMRLYNRSHTNLPYERKTAPLKELHEKIDASLREGAAVYLSTPMVRQFIDKLSGVMSIRAKGATIEDAKKALFSGGHAMLITGVYYDAVGTLLGYRVQNSWGLKYGKLGYFYMDVDYFDAFIDSVKFSKRISAPVKPPAAVVERKTKTKFVPKMKPVQKPQPKSR